MKAWLILFCGLGWCFTSAFAKNLLVPGDYPKIQLAINAAQKNDVVLVAPGEYRERLRLKAGVVVMSVGNDEKGRLGLLRAEVTVLNHPKGEGPGVIMAEGSTFDGFTITGVGRYDEVLWRKHHATQGNNQKHEHIGVAGTAGIEVGYTCIVANNLVHHIGYTGIGITGAKGRIVSPRITGNICYRNMGGGIGSMGGSKARIEKNVCFENFYAGIGHNNASPMVRNNVCYQNIRAGIGVSEGSSPSVIGNRCYKNRRAGIGIRTGKNTRPVVEDNDCYENDMAGIGIKEEAMPLIRGNRCFKNKLAGIGCRHGAHPKIIKNICRENSAAGIGVEDGAVAVVEDNLCQGNKTTGIGVRKNAEATINNNRLLENKLVAVGVRNGSRVTLSGNELMRTEGMPPLVAVLEGSKLKMTGNTLRGGGVAGVLLQGKAEISKNTFQGNGPRRGGPPNFALWVREGSEILFNDNIVKGWRHAMHASGAQAVSANQNEVRHFLGNAFVVQNTKTPATVTENIAHSSNPKAAVLAITGKAGKVSGNRLKLNQDK